MDFKETRQIPMRLASPFLPVGAGVLLFGLLAVLTLTDEPAAPSGDVAPLGSVRLVPTDRTAGAPTIPGGAIQAPDKDLLVEAKRLERQGNYLGALEIYDSLPEQQRAVFSSLIQQLTLQAGERLLFDVARRKLGRTEALEKLRAFLALDGVDAHPVRVKVEAELTAILEEVARGGRH